MKTASIIIPNHHSDLIGEVLARLRRQLSGARHADIEIIVVGVDRHGQAKSAGDVHFYETDEAANGAVNRNLGMKLAGGNVFLFLDADCLPASDWIECHLQHHAQGRAVVGGGVTFGTRNPYQLADNVSAFHDLLPFTAPGPRPYLATANLSVERSVVEEIGSLPAELTRAHDLEWTVRMREAGHTLFFDPRTIVFHDPPRRSFEALWRQWQLDAPYTLRVRLAHQRSLRTPALARHRWTLLWLMPLIAAWATVRSYAHPVTVARYGRALPLVYLTKVAWCLSAYRHYPDMHWI